MADPHQLALRIERAIRRAEDIHWATIDWLPTLAGTATLAYLWAITHP